MKVIAALDSFKGSLTSLEAGNAVKEGFLRVDPDMEVDICPLADGGEGTVASLTAGLHGRFEEVQVHGPFGAPVLSRYGILPDHTAIIEISSAAGIILVKRDELNPLKASTYGVGETIRDAITKGCRSFIIGLGGSATNDGGMGMLRALGYEFLDANGDPVSEGAQGLQDIVSVSSEHVLSELQNCMVKVACDVDNPLTGINGCSAVFGPQKGADEVMVQEMDCWMHYYAEVVRKYFPNADPDAPGSGAAGGLGFAFRTFLKGDLASGIQIVLEKTCFDKRLENADLVVTGEGRLDRQTMMGKAPAGVAELAKKHHIPVIAFAGSVSEDARICNEKGIDAYFPILRSITTLSDAMNSENARKNLADTAEQVMRLYLLRERMY